MAIIQIPLFIAALLCFFNLATPSWFNSAAADFKLPVEIDSGWEYVTYGSNIKLGNPDSNTRLALSGVFYGTGSRQKAVTAIRELDSQSGFWMVRAPLNQIITRGERVACGSTIRLTSPGENYCLHSHSSFNSPMSNNQEVCGYSAENSDSNDEWLIECAPIKASSTDANGNVNKKGTDSNKFWLREYPIRLKHRETNMYLQVLPNKAFSRPIEGHVEISCAKNPKPANSIWTANEGYYFSFDRK